MTRNDLMKISPNLTEEQITQILNEHHAELTAEKDKSKNLSNSANEELEKTKAEIERLKQLAEANNSEDLQSQVATLTQQYEDAQRTIKNMELKANLLGKGFSNDDVDSFIKTMNEGGNIADILGQMKDNAISAYDKARMENTPAPRGSGHTPPDTKDEASKIVSKVYGDSSNKNSNDILANYKK